MNIKEMIKEITETARNVGWEKDWNDYEKIALCHSELSEAVEELRNGHEPLEVYTNDDKPEGFGIELADTVIRIMHICGYHGINLQELIELKLSYNKTRPYRHGGKKA